MNGNSLSHTVADGEPHSYIHSHGDPEPIGNADCGRSADRPG